MAGTIVQLVFVIANSLAFKGSHVALRALHGGIGSLKEVKRHNKYGVSITKYVPKLLINLMQVWSQKWLHKTT